MKPASLKIIIIAYRVFKLQLSKNIKYLHGSNGVFVLAQLPFTDNTLMSTGKLLKKKIAPLAGELSRGLYINIINTIHTNSLNYCSLSVVDNDVNGFSCAAAYSKSQFKIGSLTELNKLLKCRLINRSKKITELIDTYYFSDSNITFNAGYTFISFIIAILQLRQVNEKLYQEEFEERCSLLAHNLHAHDFFWNQLFELLSELDPQLFNLFKQYKSFLLDLRPAKIFCETDLAKIDKQLKLFNNIPIIFGIDEQSPLELTQGLITYEKLYPLDLILGENIKIIICQKEHKCIISEYLKNNKLSEKVIIMSNESYTSLLNSKQIELRIRSSLSANLELIYKSNTTNSVSFFKQEKNSNPYYSKETPRYSVQSN